MKTMIFTLSMVLGSLFATSARATETLNCKSALNSFGGYSAIKIELNGNDVQISGVTTGAGEYAPIPPVFGP